MNNAGEDGNGQGVRLTLRERLRLILSRTVRETLAVVATVSIVTLAGCGSSRPESGTMVVLLSAGSPTAASGAIEIHSAAHGWSTIGHFAGSVPSAPQTVQAAAATLAAGSYDALSLGGEQVAVSISVSPELVEPVLLGVSQNVAVASEAYAGQASVNLGLRELSGHYPRLPAVQLEDQNGDTMQTAAWLGRTTVLTEFRAEAAGSSVAVLDLLRQLRAKLQSSRLVELTTDPSADTTNTLDAYARQYGVTLDAGHGLGERGRRGAGGGRRSAERRKRLLRGARHHRRPRLCAAHLQRCALVRSGARCVRDTRQLTAASPDRTGRSRPFSCRPGTAPPSGREASVDVRW